MVNLSSLNPQQRQAVETTEGPVLILAGAGTGKTRVITCRIAHMMARGIPPSQILAMTFTNKAAREMKERVAQLAPRLRARRDEPKPEAPTICTFHSLGVRILHQYIDRLGYKKNFVIYSESEQLGAVKKVLRQFHAKGEQVDPSLVVACISKLKNGMRGGFNDAETMELARILLRRYESALRACNAVDFDDLLVLTLRLFKEHPDVLEECRLKYRYVMVDEYQDTNATQFQLLRHLTSGHQNLCVVGDDDQSIYGWRGAEIANLLDMEKHFPRVKVIKLEQNYRSTNTILSAANAVIKHNARRRAKQLWSQKGQGARISLLTFQNEEEEARTIVQKIEFDRLTRRVPWGTQAVLFRTNQQARALETAFRTAKVHYHLVGGQSYFDRREIKDFIAYLKAMVNPHDDISLLRIANVPARGLSDVTMERLLAVSQERRSSVFTIMRHTDVLESFATKTREAIASFARLIEGEHHRLEAPAVPNFSLRQWANQWLDNVGYWEDLRRADKDPEAAENRMRNLKDLVATLDHPEHEGNTPQQRLLCFLENINLDPDREEEKETVGDQVTLITMHSCKGLEYPRVFVVGMEDGLLPHTRAKEEGTIDEERRLFYVAITRAQEILTVSHCLMRKKYGETITCHVSPFLKELPADLVEREKDLAPVSVSTGKDYFAAMKAMIGKPEEPSAPKPTTQG
jgi:superfamily I DNA/RNA helicase